MNGVELFTPFFSEAIAGYILKKHKLGTPLNIFELGNGSSTNLCALLNYMKTKMPNVYKNMHYYVLTDECACCSVLKTSVYFSSAPIPEEYAEKVVVKSIVVAFSFSEL